MSSSLRWLAPIVLMCASATQVWADLAPPIPCIGFFVRRDRPDRYFPPERKQQEPEYDLVIIRDPNAKEAELRIPRRMMVADASQPAPTRTAIAGLALSVAVVALGMWCMRYRPREIPRRKLVFGAAVVVLLFAALSIVSYADANAPFTTTVMTQRDVVLGDVAVNVRVVEQGDRVELVVPPEMADKIAAR